MAEPGIVKWYSIARGYGFIIRAGSGEEIFVHHSAVATRDLPLAAGERVSFEVEESPKGLRSRSVTREELPRE